jgi:hypothetical protein
MSQIDTILTLIAQKHLGIDTLETRHADSLDFHDTAVWCIRDALEAAFKAGVEIGARARTHGSGDRQGLIGNPRSQAESAWLHSRTARSSHRHPPPRRSSHDHHPTDPGPARHPRQGHQHSGGKIDWFPDNIKGGARKKVLDGLFNRALITPMAPTGLSPPRATTPWACRAPE